MIKQYLKKLIKEVLEKDGIESLKIGQHTAYVRNDKVHVSAASPKLQLQGTETSAMNLSLRENAGVIELYDETAAVVRASWSGTTGRRITPLINNTEVAEDAVIAYSKLAALASANILVGSSADVASVVSPAGDVTISNTGVTAIGAMKVTEAQIAASLNTGLGVLRVARAKYDFAVDGGVIGLITPALNATIPNNAVIVGGTINSTTAATSGGAATISIGTAAGSSAASLLGVTAVASFSLDALINSIATFAAPVKMTADGAITLTIADFALTAGVIEVTVLYFVAAA